ncbi:MAG: type IV secretory system conjugative DNA transfer family protein [Eubacteriales bacterium]|nr:type IV secretory system conjugative DNA transfer family protein [Eubacteriales bacterium]
MKFMKLILQKLISMSLKNDKINSLYEKVKGNFGYYCFCTLVVMYLYGIVINSFCGATNIFYTGVNEKTFSMNPFVCIGAVFTPEGLGVLVFIAIMYILISGKWTYLITGVKITKDERNFFVSSEGTHGTSGWMTKDEQKKILLSDTADKLPTPILCKMKGNDSGNGYLGLRTDSGLNKHILIYGATGAGKSRGFVKPYILKMVQMKNSGQNPQSMIIVDPKAELFEQYSEFLRDNGYVVKALNLLDMENSDGWNCIGETQGDVDMVQSVAEIIIRNTSEDGQKADFWDKAEGNLLIALILYVQSMRDPITNELLPLHERSLGTIYKILSSESAKSLDMKFQRLPLDHPARGPYGIFKQAASNLWGNVFIGLGSRMNVFQNKLVDKITKYHEIDLELPGKEPCAYFCIISAQDTAYEFLSSLFFSMLFKKLSDYARKHGDERGRLPVEVNFVMDEFCNVGKLLDFKKTISVVRGYGINCQIVVQSIAQLSDRYPVKEWEEIVGNCDTQLVLGCNDMMTSEYISKRCGNVTIQLTNSMAPQTPLFSPITREVTGYRETKSNNQRPLMYPEEILQMDNKECLLLLRGQKPLKGLKIIPDELSSYKELKYTRVSEYVPGWHEIEEQQKKKTTTVHYNFVYDEPEDDDEPIPVKEEKPKQKDIPKASQKPQQIILDFAEDEIVGAETDEYKETDINNIFD